MFDFFRKNALILIDIYHRAEEFRRSTQSVFHTPYYQPAPLEFIHMPKCAGTSIARKLKNFPQFGGDHHRSLNITDYYKLRQNKEIQTRYVAFLRHPVTRIWSLYQMEKRQAHGISRVYTRDLETFLNYSWEANDFYIQYLNLKFRCRNLDLGDFENALTMLKKLYFVGRADPEVLPQDWARLCDLLERDFGQRPDPIGFSNKGSYTPPTAEEIKLIVLHNPLDIMLYEQFFGVDLGLQG